MPSQGAMRILVVFATTEGHTGRLARFAAERLARASHEVWLCDAEEPNLPHADGYEAALLAGSVHRGRFQPHLVRYARREHRALNAMPSAFICVSLSMAGDNPDDRADLDESLQRFQRLTQWRPGLVHHAAGAARYTAYGFLTKLAAKLMDPERGAGLDTSRDYDLTDYEALGTFVDRFVAEASRPAEVKAPD